MPFIKIFRPPLIFDPKFLWMPFAKDQNSLTQECVYKENNRHMAYAKTLGKIIKAPCK